MADSNIVDIKLRDTILKLSDDLKEIVTEIETSPKVHQESPARTCERSCAWPSSLPARTGTA
jgi:hypothetical protein